MSHTPSSEAAIRFVRAFIGTTAVRVTSRRSGASKEARQSKCNLNFALSKLIRMWRHIEPDRLLQCAQGKELLESETDHLVSCEDCVELLTFFQEQIRNTASPEKKAALDSRLQTASEFRHTKVVTKVSRILSCRDGQLSLLLS